MAKTNGVIKIEHGIELRTLKKTGMAEALRSMKTGDSFLYPLKKRNGIGAAARAVQVKIATRTVGPQHVRVWRIA